MHISCVKCKSMMKCAICNLQLTGATLQKFTKKFNYYCLQTCQTTSGQSYLN